MNATTHLLLFHTMDPRGIKLGGIETHVRLILAHHPESVSLVLVGLDEIGDLALGQPVSLDLEGRQITFLPVAHVPDDRINRAAKTIRTSTTLLFVLGLFRHFGSIRRAVRALPTSCEVERFEFAILPKLLRLPLVLLVHNEGTSKDEMDSLLKKYWFLHLFNERLALSLANRVFAVNASIAKRVASLSGRFAAKTEVMSVSVDTKRFRPSPFDVSDDAFHVCFAGRLDAFKDPGLMFATLARLHAKLTTHPAGRFRRVVFNYIGASDIHGMPLFGDIAGITIVHGPRAAAEVAEIMQRAHAGIITSFFEGMPCYLLEMLASGRPVGAIKLPQFEALILPGATGFLTDRQETRDASAERLAVKFEDLARDIDAGRLEPDAIATCVLPYAVEAQMHRLFACHEKLARGTQARGYGSASIRSA